MSGRVLDGILRAEHRQQLDAFAEVGIDSDELARLADAGVV